MDKEYKFNINDKNFIKYLKLIVLALFVVLEVLICAQYATQAEGRNFALKLTLVVVCSALLLILVTVDSFAVNSVTAKFVFFGFDSSLLLAVCVITGNSYLALLYCFVLTQSYISINDLKNNLIIFGVSCGLYLISFVCSGMILTASYTSVFASIVKILGDCVLGVVIIAAHGIVTNFILKFYSNNQHLRQALKEADESKAQLKDVYEQLSRTAVFEERNRIAKDIHDNAGHSMTTVIMQTEAAKLLIDSNPEEAKNRIVSANIQAKNALEQMRESVHLFAGRSQTNSLKEEIEEIIAQTIDGTELKIRCDLEDVAVDDEIFRFICNSVKECLANGVRHGKATAFYVEMKRSLSGLALFISDNGCGTDGEVKEGFGLKGLREKAEKLGGRCDFSSEAGEGFEVEITLPLNKN